MQLIDTHTHLYLKNFDNDRHETIHKAMQAGVEKFVLPNIDAKSLSHVLTLVDDFPVNCFPAIGLHPTDVKSEYKDELKRLEGHLKSRPWVAVGEIGIDLYWDKTYINEQIEAFHQQIEWANQLKLPIIIHARDSLDLIINEVKNNLPKASVPGVFHCFTGDLKQAEDAIGMGFYLGIGGVLTYKKAGLDKVVENLPLSHLVLETDSPFLPPVPHRGKRNESAYILHVAQKLAEVKNLPIEEVAIQTTRNANRLFKLT